MAVRSVLNLWAGVVVSAALGVVLFGCESAPSPTSPTGVSLSAQDAKPTAVKSLMQTFNVFAPDRSIALCQIRGYLPNAVVTVTQGAAVVSGASSCPHGSVTLGLAQAGLATVSARSPGWCYDGTVTVPTSSIVLTMTRC